MKLRKIFYVFALLALIFTFGACTEKTIAAPTGVKLEGSVISWNAVEKAEGYKVFVNDEEKADITECKYDIKTLNIEEGSVYIKTYKGKLVSEKSSLVKYLAAISTPANVKITDKVVSWDAVDGATKYVVLVNETENEVTGLSFDLSNIALEEAAIKVRAVCDSAVSADSETINYVKDPAKAKNELLKTWMSTFGFENVDATEGDFESESDYNYFLRQKQESEKLAEACVENGVKSVDVLAFYEFATFIDEADDPSVSEVLTKITELLDGEMNVKTMLDFMISYVSSEGISTQIEDLEDEIASLKDSLANAYPEEVSYYLNRIKLLEKQVQIFKALQTTINNIKDRDIEAIVAVVNCLNNIIKGVNKDLLKQIEALIPSEENPNLDFPKLIEVKNQALELIETNLPKKEDLVVLLDFVNQINVAFNNAVTPLMTTEESVDEMLAQTKLVLAYLKSVDAQFVLDIVGFESLAFQSNAYPDESIEPENPYETPGSSSGEFTMSAGVSQVFVGLYVLTDIYEFMQTEEAKALVPAQKYTDEQIVANLMSNLDTIIETMKDLDGTDISFVKDINFAQLLKDVKDLLVIPTKLLSYTSETNKGVVYAWFDFLADQENEETLNKLIPYAYDYLSCLLGEVKDDQINAIYDLLVNVLQNVFIVNKSEINDEDLPKVDEFMKEIQDSKEDLVAILKTTIKYLNEFVTSAKKNKLLESLVTSDFDQEVIMKVLEEVVYNETNNAEINDLVNSVFDFLSKDIVMEAFNLTVESLQEMKAKVLVIITIPKTE